MFVGQIGNGINGSPLLCAIRKTIIQVDMGPCILISGIDNVTSVQ